MNPSNHTISLHPKSTTSRNSRKTCSTQVAIGELDLPNNQKPVVFHLPLEPTHFYIAPGTSEPPNPADRPPPVPHPTPLSPPPTPYSSASSSLPLPEPQQQHSSSEPVVDSPEVKANCKSAKKVHFALSEHSRSPSPEIIPEKTRAVRRQKGHQDSTTRPPEQALTSPLPDIRSGFATQLPIFRCGKLRLPKLKSTRKPEKHRSSPSRPACRLVQPLTMAPPPLSPYELGAPAEYLKSDRARYYEPHEMEDVYEYVPVARGASVPTRQYSYPIPILRSPSTSQPRSAQGDVEEEVKITHIQASPIITASPHLSHHGHAYEVYHFCSVCRSPRSRKYHKLHPVEPGQHMEPGVCRKCKTSKSSSDEEERVVINRPGRNPLSKMERVRAIPVDLEREDRGRPRYKYHYRQRVDSRGRVLNDVQGTEGHRGTWRTRSDSRVRITIEEKVPSHHRRSRSRTVIRMQEWDDHGQQRSSPSKEIPARPSMSVRHVSDAERKLRCHPQAFRYGFFTKSKSRTRAPPPPSARMSKLSVEEQPLPKAHTEASQHGSQATRTHASWVTYPASSLSESPRASKTHDTRSTSVLRSGSRPSRPSTSPRRHIQARQMSHRAEALHCEDEPHVRFTPGPQDERVRRRRGYDGHFSDEAERMSGYYWYDAPRQLPTTPTQAIPSSEPTEYSIYGYRRHSKEPVSLTVLPRASMSTAPIRAPEPPPAADLEGPAALSGTPGLSTRLWTQDSANVGSSYAGSRSSYHLVDVREVDATDSIGYQTRIREIEDTRYSDGEKDKAKIRTEETIRGSRRG